MDTKKSIKSMALIYALLYFSLFLIFYLPNYVKEINELVEIQIKTPYLIVRGVMERLFQFFIPVSGASLVLSTSGENNKKALIKNSLLLCLPLLIYSLPYCYLYALSLGFDSIEGTGISLIFSAIGIALQWCHVLLLVVVCRFITARCVASGEASENTSESLAESSLIKQSFDFSLALPFSVLVVSLLELLYNLILEIINTASFFIEAGGTYTLNDVIDIVFTYVFLLMTMLISHAASYCIAKRVERREGDAEI